MFTNELIFYILITGAITLANIYFWFEIMIPKKQESVDPHDKIDFDVNLKQQISTTSH
jgi:hypothetical protein